MYEYLKKNHKEINCYWITKNIDLYNKYKNVDSNFLYYKSAEARQLRIRAGVVFFTNSLYDLGDYMLHSGSYKVALWHGVLMKRIYLASNEYRNHCKAYKIIASIKKMLFWDISRNLTPVTSKNVKDFYKICFGIKEQSISVLGQPRNDVFIKHKLENTFIQEYNSNKVILFMPTYRAKEESASILYDLFLELCENDYLKDILNKLNYVIKIKCHFLQKKPNINNNARVYFLDDEDVDDPQILMSNADILVTDFSSAYIDFSLLDRPIFFLVKDKNEYMKEENGIFFDIFEYVKNIFFDDVNCFANALLDLSKGELNWKKSQLYIKSFFNDEISNMTSYSENIYLEVCKRINKRKNK